MGHRYHHQGCTGLLAAARPPTQGPDLPLAAPRLSVAKSSAKTSAKSPVGGVQLPTQGSDHGSPRSRGGGCREVTQDMAGRPKTISDPSATHRVPKARPRAHLLTMRAASPFSRERRDGPRGQRASRLRRQPARRAAGPLALFAAEAPLPKTRRRTKPPLLLLLLLLPPPRGLSGGQTCGQQLPTWPCPGRDWAKIVEVGRLRAKLAPRSVNFDRHRHTHTHTNTQLADFIQIRPDLVQHGS